MALATDGLNRIFSNRIFCAKALRNLDLMVVENSASLKKRYIYTHTHIYALNRVTLVNSVVDDDCRLIA
jgi:hypothetical protein